MPVATANESPLLTTNEAAAYMRIHPVTVRRAVLDGKLKALKAGKDLRFRKEDLDNYLNRP